MLAVATKAAGVCARVASPLLAVALTSAAEAVALRTGTPHEAAGREATVSQQTATPPQSDTKKVCGAFLRTLSCPT